MTLGADFSDLSRYRNMNISKWSTRGSIYLSDSDRNAVDNATDEPWRGAKTRHRGIMKDLDLLRWPFCNLVDSKGVVKGRRKDIRDSQWFGCLRVEAKEAEVRRKKKKIRRRCDDGAPGTQLWRHK